MARSLLKSSPRVLNCLEVEGFFCVFALVIQEIGPSDECSCAGELFSLRMMKDNRQREQKWHFCASHQKLTRPCECSASYFNSARCKQPSDWDQGGCGRCGEGMPHVGSAVPIPRLSEGPLHSMRLSLRHLSLSLF